MKVDSERISILKDMTLAYLRMVYPESATQDEIMEAINEYIDTHGDLIAARNAIVADMQFVIATQRTLH